MFVSITYAALYGLAEYKLLFAKKPPRCNFDKRTINIRMATVAVAAENN